MKSRHQTNFFLLPPLSSPSVILQVFARKSFTFFTSKLEKDKLAPSEKQGTWSITRGRNSRLSFKNSLSLSVQNKFNSLCQLRLTSSIYKHHGTDVPLLSGSRRFYDCLWIIPEAANGVEQSALKAGDTPHNGS